MILDDDANTKLESVSAVADSLDSLLSASFVGIYARIEVFVLELTAE